MLTSFRLLQPCCLTCLRQLPSLGLRPSQLPCTRLTDSCARHRQLRVNGATAELLAPMAAPSPSRAAPSFQLLGTKASATSLTRLLTTCSKFRWPFLRDGAPTSPRLTAPAAATSWGMTAGASPPIPLLCCCPSQHSSHSDPARALRASTSLPCSQPSVGLPSHSEEPSPAEARRAGDRQAIRACALRSLSSGSTGPRLLPLQPRSCSRAAALAAPSSWNPTPGGGMTCSLWPVLKRHLRGEAPRAPCGHAPQQSPCHPFPPFSGALPPSPQGP